MSSFPSLFKPFSLLSQCSKVGCLGSSPTFQAPADHSRALCVLPSLGFCSSQSPGPWASGFPGPSRAATAHGQSPSVLLPSASLPALGRDARPPARPPGSSGSSDPPGSCCGASLHPPSLAPPTQDAVAPTACPLTSAATQPKPKLRPLWTAPPPHFPMDSKVWPRQPPCGTWGRHRLLAPV